MDWETLFRIEDAGDRFAVTELVFHGTMRAGEIGLALTTNEPVADTEPPVLTVDGVTMARQGDGTFADSAPEQSRHRGGNLRHGYLYAGKVAKDLGETVAVTVTWLGETHTLTLDMMDAYTTGISEFPYLEFKGVIGY